MMHFLIFVDKFLFHFKMTTLVHFFVVHPNQKLVEYLRLLLPAVLFQAVLFECLLYS